MTTIADCSGLVAAGFSSTSYVCTILQTFQLLANASGYVPPTYASSEVSDEQHFDFIIVGCGTAGLVLANRLSEIDSFTVLCIEAGGDPPQMSTVPGLFPFLVHSPEWDWDYYSQNDGYSSQGLNRNRIAHTRGKMLGGSSSLDHIIYERGTMYDYQEWTDLGLEGWDFETVLEYFKKSQNNLEERILNGPTAEYHSTGGYFSVNGRINNTAFDTLETVMFEAFEELGITTIWDINCPSPNGTAKSSYKTTSTSYRASTAQEFLLPVIDRTNLYILKNALVTKVIIDDSNIATGVCLELSSGETLNLYADNEVIMSAGVFNSAQLLMLSGVGPKGHLEALGIEVKADLPVGQNMQDHISIPTVFSGQQANIIDLETLAASADGTTMPLPHVGGTFSLDENAPDYQHISLFFGASSPLFLYLLNVDFNYRESIVMSHINNYPDRELMLSLAVLTKPVSRGSVTLRSTDPKDPPLIYSGFYAKEEDINRSVKLVKTLYNIQDTTYFQSVGGEFSRPAIPECDNIFEYLSDDYWKCYVRVLAATTFHPVGTCSMGSVTENTLKVKGIENLRVVDDSIMPVVPNAKTSAVTIMIAERAADFIKEEYGVL